MNNVKEVSDFILKWNIDFPIDRWWRKTHSVAFNSQRHREVTFIDMLIEWEEEFLYNKIKETDVYTTGDYLKKKEVDDSISEEAFNNIDLDNL